MKSLISILCLSLLFTLSCTRSDEFQPTKETDVVSGRTTDKEKVCFYLQAAYSLFLTTDTDFDDWFNPNLPALLDLTNPSPTQISTMNSYVNAGVANMFAASEDLETGYYDVMGTHMSQSEFYDYANECNLIDPRWCWICNSAACAVSTSMVDHATVLPYLGIGWIGVFLHCNH